MRGENDMQQPAACPHPFFYDRHVPAGRSRLTFPGVSKVMTSARWPCDTELFGKECGGRLRDCGDDDGDDDDDDENDEDDGFLTFTYSPELCPVVTNAGKNNVPMDEKNKHKINTCTAVHVCKGAVPRAAVYHPALLANQMISGNYPWCCYATTSRTAQLL